MVKQNSPDMLSLAGRTYIATDSGLLTSYTPAQLNKPQGVLRRIANRLFKFDKPVIPSETSQQGSGAASPSTYYQTIWAQRYERAQMIADCRRLYLEDSRVFRSVNMFATEATRGGVKIRIDGTDATAKKSQAVAEKLLKLLTIQCLESWARTIQLEGDLFIQIVVEGNEIVRLMRMPAGAMERLSDDADQFHDPMRAFAQLDITTWQELSVWPEAFMVHVRWLHTDGDRYGIPEIVSVRRFFRKLDLVEASQTTRRLARASQSRLWNIGTRDKVGSAQAVLDFKNTNGIIEGNREPFGPMEVTRDFYGNGLIDVKVIEGDPHIADIDDMKYLQDVACAGLPTPKAVFGLDAEAINRDVLEDQKDQWLKDTQRINNAIDEVINRAMEFFLMLQGIDPDLVKWTNIWTRSSVEKESDRIDSLIALRESGLISKPTALNNISEYVGIRDPEREMDALSKEEEEFRARQEKEMEENGGQPQEGEEGERQSTTRMPGAHRENGSKPNPFDAPTGGGFIRRGAAHKERRL